MTFIIQPSINSTITAVEYNNDTVSVGEGSENLVISSFSGLTSISFVGDWNVVNVSEISELTIVTEDESYSFSSVDYPSILPLNVVECGNDIPELSITSIYASCGDGFSIEFDNDGLLLPEITSINIQITEGYDKTFLPGDFQQGSDIVIPPGVNGIPFNGGVVGHIVITWASGETSTFDTGNTDQLPFNTPGCDFG